MYDAYVRDYPDYAYNYYDIYQDYEVWGMKNDWLELDVLFVAEKWFNKDIEHQDVLSKGNLETIIDKFKDRNMRLAIFDAVESLAFDQIELMIEMYGSNIIDYVASFALKQTRDGVDKDILKESREITDALKKAVQKVVFDNKEKIC